MGSFVTNFTPSVLLNQWLFSDRFLLYLNVGITFFYQDFRTAHVEEEKQLANESTRIYPKDGRTFSNNKVINEENEIDLPPPPPEFLNQTLDGNMSKEINTEREVRCCFIRNLRAHWTFWALVFISIFTLIYSQILVYLSLGYCRGYLNLRFRGRNRFKKNIWECGNFIVVWKAMIFCSTSILGKYACLFFFIHFHQIWVKKMWQLSAKRRQLRNSSFGSFLHHSRQFYQTYYKPKAFRLILNQKWKTTSA